MTWQTTHQELLREDAGYRKRFHAYLIMVLGLACLLLPFYLPLFGIRLFGPTVDLSIILGVAVVGVSLTLRQFQFQRQAIRRHLQSKGAA